MDLVETLLPGVGIRYELPTRSGLLLGIVVHREGSAEIAVYDAKDPDRATDVFRLDADEADAIADVLGATRLTQRFADLSREVPGLQSARLAIEPGSQYVGRTLGDTRARTRTGCSVVAVVRGTEVVPSPDPQQVLREGDVLVVIGSAEGLQKVAGLLSEPA